MPQPSQSQSSESQSSESQQSESAHVLPRRGLFRGALAAGGVLAVSGLGARAALGAPALVRSGRPSLTHGVQSGDVTASSATVWTRADRPSRMIVEVATDPTFRN